MFQNKVALFDLFSIKLQRFRLCGGDQGFPVALDLRMRKLGQGNQTHEVGGRPGPSDALIPNKERNLCLIARLRSFVHYTV